jgi:hypothetical protein
VLEALVVRGPALGLVERPAQDGDNDSPSAPGRGARVELFHPAQRAFANRVRA